MDCVSNLQLYALKMAHNKIHQSAKTKKTVIGHLIENSQCEKLPVGLIQCSSVGKALHRYRGGHGLDSRPGLNIVSGFNKLCV